MNCRTIAPPPDVGTTASASVREPGFTPDAPGAHRRDNRGRKANKRARRRISRAKVRSATMLRRSRAAYDGGRRRTLGHLNRLYLDSYHVLLAAVDRANRKLPPARRLPARELEAVARRIDLRQRCAEPVRVRWVRKASGGRRPICDLGIENRARALVVRDLLGLARDRIPANAYYTGNGGMKAAMGDIAEQVGRPDVKWVGLIDVVDMFGSFDVGAVATSLARIANVPKDVIENVMASRLNFAEPARRTRRRSNHLRGRTRPLRGRATRRKTDHREDGRSGRSAHVSLGHINLEDTASRGPRGLPQGSPVSPLLAELLLAPTLARFGVSYADDVIAASATRSGIREATETLRRALRRHHVGRFELRMKERRLCDGANVLGAHFRKRRGVLTIQPTKEALQRFRHTTLVNPASEKRAGRKINKEKIRQVAQGMVEAMPLSDEGRFLMQVMADVRPEIVANWRPGRFDIRNRVVNLREDLAMIGIDA